MILHDTIYEWDGKSNDGEKPVAWWPGAYRIRIIDLTAGTPQVIHLKSRAVICRNRDKGTSIRNCIESFAKKVSQKYDLDITRVLWVEIGQEDPSDVQIATLKRVSPMGGNDLFAASWRPARPNELESLSPFLVDFTDDPPLEPPKAQGH
ncbi:hypothetical protein HRM2_42650 [Desulforapulum autotrophicum HRM2]|uniref:Uncharacterized protein n=1 Tax=Desulforapulum autotrophicum (strain ATCC 43914 / DSM 3382 / VKM B-1955 / HRM2) TaxID=177437 RepID=C0QDQ0_DESAH|nr:hypothetical protein [Desulforapulum autotrophicum]ACN17321.1 hypothetical protein HRM2_42650 [Desulforapulum autotrophicum HRM2]